MSNRSHHHREYTKSDSSRDIISSAREQVQPNNFTTQGDIFATSDPLALSMCTRRCHEEIKRLVCKKEKLLARRIGLDNAREAFGKAETPLRDMSLQIQAEMATKRNGDMQISEHKLSKLILAYEEHLDDFMNQISRIRSIEEKVNTEEYQLLEDERRSLEILHALYSQLEPGEQISARADPILTGHPVQDLDTASSQSSSDSVHPLILAYWDAVGDVRVREERLINLAYDYDEEFVRRAQQQNCVNTTSSSGQDVQRKFAVDRERIEAEISRAREIAERRRLACLKNGLDPKSRLENSSTVDNGPVESTIPPSQPTEIFGDTVRHLAGPSRQHHMNSLDPFAFRIVGPGCYRSPVSSITRQRRTENWVHALQSHDFNVRKDWPPPPVATSQEFYLNGGLCNPGINGRSAFKLIPPLMAGNLVADGHGLLHDTATGFVCMPATPFPRRRSDSDLYVYARTYM